MESEYYTRSLHTINAAHPRHNPASTISPLDRLQVVYYKYVANPTKFTKQRQRPSLNLLFGHGNGLNKASWTRIIHQLFSGDNLFRLWQLNTVIAFDSVNHCDSAIANKNKLGVVFDWRDNGRDMVEIILHENLHLTASKFILVGHSFSGFGALHVNILYPHLFDSIVAVDPVIAGFPDDQIVSIRERLNGSEQKNALQQLRKDKLKQMLLTTKSEFDSEKQLIQFFTTTSLFRRAQPDVLADTLNEEIYHAKDSTGKNKVCCKTSAEQQLIIYSSSGPGFDFFDKTFPFLKNQICIITGSNSFVFRLKLYDKLFRPSNPKLDIVLKIISNAYHLFPIEKPDAMLNELLSYINLRFDRQSYSDNAINFSDFELNQSTNIEYELRKKQFLRLQQSHLHLLEDNKAVDYTDEEREEIFKNWFETFKKFYSKPDFIPVEPEESKLELDKLKL